MNSKEPKESQYDNPKKIRLKEGNVRENAAIHLRQDSRLSFLMAGKT